MEFIQVKADAERWLGEQKSKFKLAACDATENRLVFCTPDEKASFNIICPNKGESWSVCSEEEEILFRLQDTMEFLDSQTELTIEAVLATITARLSDLCDSQSDEAVSRKAEKSKRGGESNSEEEEEEEEEEDMYCYYDDADPDVQDDFKKPEEKVSQEATSAYKVPVQGVSHGAVQRLQMDLRRISGQGDKYGFTAGPREDNLFLWDVKLLKIPEDSVLGKDLKSYAARYNREAAIEMEMQFPGDYPYSPPFLRIIRPRFKFLTGHVTIGGSICMEMLTKSGWRPCNDTEGILVQVRCEILSDPRASLHQTQADSPYTENEARAAFSRMVERYGWR